ncbi:quinone oxidoreductase family protein [Desulfatitalea alkaliphila]|uniref:Quinone oxidoreductase n=1 Tax=Desulfatitalea alkaliphila TaxID=2929485 RepID=A0AA41R5Z8_9BACT|nr:quinone oxidoreductase [Desulfatitalea alkaliphila]MCJ8499793.1 quinone oxidoreductase [Desulfatitalea alkaliphila]
MGKAIRIHTTGGPEVMRWEDVDPGRPGAGQVLIKHAAIGLNFIDIYHRTGLYPLPGLPAVLGMEGAGTVEAVGDGVTDWLPGDRAVCASGPPGAYATHRLVPADRLVPLPQEIAFEQAAAMMLKGMTARYLLHGCFGVQQGHTILVHAAAGGVGSIVCQWARHLGATVIGTFGSEEKAALATALGCEHPILYRKENFVERVKTITNGEGVDVVYDGVGRDTFFDSLKCLRPLGTMVSFGQASGKVPPLDIGLLATHGSLFLTRPTLLAYTHKREELLAHAQDLFEVVRQGAVKIDIRRRYPLAEAARAHGDLEAGRTMGAAILLP